MEAELKSEIIKRLEQLSKNRILEVLVFVEFLLAKTSSEKDKPIQATDKGSSHTIEAGGWSDFYYDDLPGGYTLEGENQIIWRLKPIRLISKRRLLQYLNELIALAKTVTPDVEAVIDIPGAEGQHAWLMIYVPDELEEQIGDLVSQRAHDIFIETGYDIAAIVYEKSQRQDVAAETSLQQ